MKCIFITYIINMGIDTYYTSFIDNHKEIIIVAFICDDHEKKKFDQENDSIHQSSHQHMDEFNGMYRFTA